MGLFRFLMDSDLRFPQFLALLQQDNKKSVFCNSHSCGFLFDVLMYASREPHLCRNDFVVTSHTITPLPHLHQVHNPKATIAPHGLDVPGPSGTFCFRGGGNCAAGGTDKMPYRCPAAGVLA